MKQFVKNIVRRLGYEVLTYSYASELLPKHHLQKIFDVAGIDCVLDVGANLGQFRDFLRDAVGYRGWILSFEPIAEHVDILRKRAEADPRWKIFDFALGDCNATAVINVTAGGPLSSFLEPLSALQTSLGPAMHVRRGETVQIKTLDSIRSEIEEMCSLYTTFLKLDTQGYDLKVVYGALDALRDIPALQTELSFLPIYKEMPSFQEVLQHLQQLGFDVTGLFPVSRDGLLRAREFDCVMIRRDLRDRKTNDRPATPADAWTR